MQRVDQPVGGSWWVEWDRAGQRSRMPLDRPIRIGREAGCDILVPEPTVSRLHAVVTITGGQILVDASRSTNGIILERGRADRVTLAAGQPFRIGSAIFRVVWEPMAAAVHAAPPQPAPSGFAADASAAGASATARAGAGGKRGALAAVGAIAVLCAVGLAGVVALAPGHSASPSPVAASHGAQASGSAPGSVAPIASLAPMPSGWQPMQYAPPGSPVAGLDSGYLSFRTTDGRVAGLTTSAAPSQTDQWLTKASAADSYAFEYPGDWKCRLSTVDKHDTFVITPPGNASNTPGGASSISVYWTAQAPTPQEGDPTVADLGFSDKPEPQTRVFTVGGLDRQAVAAIPWRGGFVVIAGDVPDDASTRAFLHVLDSWRAK